MRIFILFPLVFLGINANSYATTPYPNEDYVSKTGRYRVVLSPEKYPEDPPLVLYDNKDEQQFPFSLEQLRLELRLDPPNYQFLIRSTAGLGWYRNSIGVFDHDEKFFILKLAWPQFVVLNLQKRLFEETPSPELLNEARTLITSLALEWLYSEDPYKRETGAITCKDLKATAGIERLKSLLHDPAVYLTGSGSSSDDSGKMVFYVRMAAEEALLALGESVSEITIELSEKKYLDTTKHQKNMCIDWNTCR